jgi:hypothetical protein
MISVSMLLQCVANGEQDTVKNILSLQPTLL